MKHRLLLSALVMLCGAGWAAAQGPGPYVRPSPNPNNPYARPTFSPYLNLVRSNNSFFSAGINYAGIVRPQFQMYDQLNQLQGQVGALQTGLNAVDAQSTLPTTGHATQFLNTSHYFGASGGQTGAARRTPAVTATIPQGRSGGIGTAPPRKR